MVIGTTLFKMDGNPYYSPEFGRGGLSATFTVDVTHLVGAPTLTVTVESRNSEDTAWTTIGTFSAITGTIVESKDLGSLNEIVRFKYEFDAGDQSTDGAHFLMMAPSWRPY
jgi:hypothetical protein